MKTETHATENNKVDVTFPANTFGSIITRAAITLAAIFIAPHVAFANGFLCTSLEQNTQIDIFLKPGTLEQALGAELMAETMVIRDLTVSKERQHIATFRAQDQLLENAGNLFKAYVDMNHPEVGSKGKRIGGTRLGYLNSIQVEIDFTFQEEVEQGIRLAAQAIYTKHNGVELAEDFECVYVLNRSQLESYIDAWDFNLH